MEQMKPMDIEKRSFAIITELLGDRRLDPENELVIKRVIHTTADFDYVDNLAFSGHAVQKAIAALRAGCDIVTDTQMVKAGINKTILASLGGEVHCFMSDADVAAEAKERGVTRAFVSMERAAALPKPCIFAIGNAPTALFSLEELMEAGKLRPALIIGVPVGFVNVVESKERIIQAAAAPYIVSRGRKGGSNVAAAICNAMLYQIKAAAWMLLSGSKKESIRLLTPKGMELALAVEDIYLSPDCVRCAIRKDSGDDPDITRDTLIYAEVRKTETVGIVIDGGQGVGRVTKPGLDQPVGAAAINSVPRRMIQEAVEEVCGLLGYTGGLYVVISAPDGETLAKKTFNPRLGIEGGISILGTTGIVEPMSEQALVDTIHVELRQRRAGGADYVLLAPGNYGVDYIKGAMGIDPATAVMTSNFIGDALEICRELGFRGALLIGHIGKLVKLAGGMWNTHSRYGDCRMDILTACAAAEGLHGGAAAEMLCCATCDDALRLLKEQGLYDAVLHRLAGRIDDMMHYKCSDIETGAILFSKEYGYLCETKGASKLLRRIKED